MLCVCDVILYLNGEFITTNRVTMNEIKFSTISNGAHTHACVYVHGYIVLLIRKDPARFSTAPHYL